MLLMFSMKRGEKMNIKFYQLKYDNTLYCHKMYFDVSFYYKQPEIVLQIKNVYRANRPNKCKTADLFYGMLKYTDLCNISSNR